MRSTYNNFLLDGLDNNAYSTSNQGYSSQVVQPSPDAISEFQVITSNFSAEYGRVGGGVINTALRAGTNEFHGSDKNGTTGAPSALKSFDLKTGAPKGSYDFPGDNALCNDIAIAPDGTAYASDTIVGSINRLKKGASALDVWIKDAKLAGIDGLAFADSNTLVVNTVTTGHLFRIPVKSDGSAGDIAELKPSQTLTQPDGMRAIGKNEFLLIEGAGRLDHVTVSGDEAKIEVLKEGFNGPTAVTRVGDTAWVLEGKLKYMNDPKFKDQDPGPFKVYAVPFKGK